MTKHLRFLIVLLLTLVWSVGWAQKVTLDFSESSNPWNLPTSYSMDEKSYTNNGYTISFKNGTVGKGYCLAQYSKNYFIQMGTTGMTLVLPAFDFDVSKIVVEGHSSGNDKVTQNIFVAETPICTETKGSKGTNTYTILNEYQTKGTVYKLKVTNANVTKITSIKIYEKETTSSKTPTKVAFPEEYSNKTFTFTEGKLEGFTAPKATEANNVAGTIKYSSNNESVVSVNASTGELSFPGYGEATITATFTPADAETYAVSTDSYKVKNEAKKSDNVLTFSGDFNSFDKAVSYKANLPETNVSFVGSDNKTYTFISNGGKSGSARFLLRAKTGKLQSPTFPSYNNGYNVVITYGSTSTGYPSVTANGKKVTGSVQGDYTDGTGATLSLDVADGSAFTVTSGTNALAISKIEITPNKVDETPTITLNESATNTIEAKTGVNVTLKRPMNIGRWNTFCVPFSIDATQVASQFGEGTQIANYSVSVDNEIDFATVQSNDIVAGKAYLVKPTKEAAIEGYTFSNVNITALEPTKETVDNGAIDFRGIYNPTDITVDLPTNTFAAGIVGNVVKKAVSGSNMKGFRAFFIIPEGAGAQSSYMLKIDGTVTSINSINGADVVVNAPVYNLHGQRVDGNNLTPGIYVKAGKKFVVK